MIQLLWPTRKRPDPTLVGRLGRVLHWSLTAFAVLLLILAYFDFTTANQIETSTGVLWSDGSPSPERRQELALWHWNQAMRWLLYALGAFMAGRAARYVLSGE
jgi:hypothetical protein